MRTLVDEKLERRSRLLTLERQRADVAGQRSRVTTAAGRLQETIGEMQAQAVFLRGQRITDAAKEQRSVQAEIAAAREKLAVGRDVDRRRSINAPVAGTVVNLRLVTPGSVLLPGQPILNIVPSGGRVVVVVARLGANDNDVVQPSLLAEIRLSPYKARSVPTLIGEVRQVAADAVLDENTGTLYYETEVAIDPAALEKLDGVKLLSGMPAEVYIQLGSRSLVRYFRQPLTDSFNRGFRED